MSTNQYYSICRKITVVNGALIGYTWIRILIYIFSFLFVVLLFSGSRCCLFTIGIMRGCYQNRKEMFYLMTHSTHFIYGYMASVSQNNPCP